jgi:hypothetical protein
MISSEVQRTLVKSPPELWAELSEPATLAHHLGELGEIRITRTEPEKTVEWEAADTTGKVTLVQSGWGTKVTLTVTRELAEPDAPVQSEPTIVNEPVPEPEPEPLAVEEPEPEPRPGFFARLFRRRSKELVQTELEQPAIIEIDESERSEDDETPDIAAEEKAAEEAAAEQVTGVLTAALDRLGAAHHRPFSRA